jgi:G3E family GTPase
MAFSAALEILITHQGEDLLRVKGIVQLREKPDEPVVIHGVQHLIHEPVWLDRWPDDDHHTNWFSSPGISRRKRWKPSSAPGSKRTMKNP